MQPKRAPTFECTIKNYRNIIVHSKVGARFGCIGCNLNYIYFYLLKYILYILIFNI
jgi:hypothetical protein